MSKCAYSAWWFLPLEHRRRLRVLYTSTPDPRLFHRSQRLDHLTDHTPRCKTCRQENLRD
jgi:hypothetical protein